MNEYDVRKAFEEMELELIASMKRNLQRHLDWEKDEGFNWNMWQVEQLKTLENFKKENQKIFNKKFSSINAEIANFLKSSYEASGFETEIGILDEIAKGMFVNNINQKGINSSFFSLNKSKMEALIKATTKDIEKAEHAMLRMVNDQYRKTIFNAQVMANSGAFTLQQSIDKATKDFLRTGINCIQYKNGRRVNIATYAEMAIRTANKRAVLISEGDVRNVYGIHTVRISSYGGCSETCLPWQGRIYIDDVYSGGTKEEAQEKKLPLLSDAIAGGLFHPNCKHRASTYFYDLKKTLSKLEEDGVENPPEEQEHRKNLLHIQQQKRLENGFLDSNNIEQAKKRKEQWEIRDKKLGFEYNDDSKDEYLDILNSFKQKDDLPSTLVLNEKKSRKINYIFDELVERSTKANAEILAFADIQSCTIVGGYSNPKGMKYSEPTKEQLDILDNAENNSLFSLHTHPSKNPFSFADIVTHNIVLPIGTSIIQTIDGYQYFLFTPKGSRIVFENSKEIAEFKKAGEQAVKTIMKEKNISYSEAKHEVIKGLADKMGWEYGRKKR
ncbi:MAG: phage minor capsid protein [Massilimicrobiota timonensis]